MRRPLSIALRLTLLYGIAAAIVFPVFGWMISRSTENHFQAEDMGEIEIIANAVQGVLSEVRTTVDFTMDEQRFDDILVGHHSASLYIAGKGGRTLYASAGPDLSRVAQTMNLNTSRSMTHQWSDTNHHYRVLIRQMHNNVSTDNEAYTVVVAVPIDYHLRFLASFHRTLWIMIAASIAIMSLIGWIAVRQGHAPLRDIVSRIRRISANELSARISPERVPRELTDLAVSFNEMLQRVDEAFNRLSGFNADIAHELRTPITNMMTQTEVALSRARTIDEYREVLYSNMEEYDRMAQMVGEMLFLAQADNSHGKKNIEEIDLTGEVCTLFDYYEGWAEERCVTLALEGSASVYGDRQMLRRALSNLLSNAIRHTTQGKSAVVRLNSRNGRTIIEVENPGPTIPAEHLPRLFDRFYRVDPSRQRDGDGAGLGLAIVKSIVDAHGGQIYVESRNERTCFRMILPQAYSLAEKTAN